LADLDGDGRTDLLSGSWPGEIFLFRGGPGRSFAAPEMLRDREGKFINIGGGIAEQEDGSLLITGNGTFETTEEGLVVRYHGQTLKCSDERPISITGTASAVHAVDWDGDGDLDLLIGDIGGSVYLVPNEGERGEPAFGTWMPLEAEGAPVHVPGDAGPFCADWDGDGAFDLLVGAGDGSVWLFRNARAEGKTVLRAPERLVAPGKAAFGRDAPRDPTRGIRAKVCAVDWNGDGRLDLLLGDFATQAPPAPSLSKEERAAQDALREALDALMPGTQELANKLYGGRGKLTPEARAELQQQYGEATTRMRELRDQLPPEYENHGWVWLFLRKAPEGP